MTHRAELLSHANRVLKDSAKAEEVTQESFIKLILAAPELDSEQHAISYLHKTIENLCLDVFRAESRRPKLIVIDDATAEIESNWQVAGDHSREISAAEDAAIIRQALSLLSPAERAALIMWEIEGRSTQEIATELGIKESAVRHTVSRARSSLRKVLSTLVVDEKRGLTALDLLSTTYKRASELAQKSGKIAMSLFLVVTAFLGFNSLTGSESIQTSINSQISKEPFVEGTIPVPTSSISNNSNLKTIAPAKFLESKADVEAELEFAKAQLESAGVMLQTLQLIEGDK